jgi:hypothetical protein
MCNQTLKAFITNTHKNYGTEGVVFITVLSYGWYVLGLSNGSDYNAISVLGCFSIQFLLPANQWRTHDFNKGYAIQFLECLLVTILFLEYKKEMMITKYDNIIK